LSDPGHTDLSETRPIKQIRFHNVPHNLLNFIFELQPTNPYKKLTYE
jgi:hypothetical protein